ncbi:MAG TPA: universal stress protein [Casimicrobiaceae bacterium]|nr:universal stress protein [Casimicrobiaceae bacterium]
MKILFATDGSKASLDALEALLARYDWFRDPPALTLVTVHPPIPYGMASRWVGKHTVEEHYAEESAAALASCRAALDKRGIMYTAVTRVGEPASEIVALAHAEGYDCIAMGVHGHTALATLVLGSVAQKVIASTSTPVLLLK